MRKKGLYLAGMTLLLFLLTACGGDSTAGNVPLSPKDAVELATEWAEAGNLIMSGGLYQEGEYTTFTHKGMEYRYLASHLDTKKKLKAEMHKYVTKKKAKRFIKENGILKHKGKMAQPEIETSSLLQWEIATARELKVKKGMMTFELTVPIGDTRTAETFTVKYVYVKKVGWRIEKFNE